MQSMKLGKGARLVGMSIMPGPEDGSSAEPSTSAHPAPSTLEVTKVAAADQADEDTSDESSEEEEEDGDAEDAGPVEAEGPWLLLVTSKVTLKLCSLTLRFSDVFMQWACILAQSSNIQLLKG